MQNAITQLAWTGLLALTVIGSASAGAQEPDAPTRLALLVGVDRYPREGGFEDLGGAVRDTLALRDVLVARFGFAPEDVLLLHDERATHAAIVRAFDEHLLRRAGPDSECVFYFSGHGSRVPDASGGEPDGLDSTYVAHDSRSGGHRGERDLCDDELFSLVAALCAKTPRVTVIADSCHSGGGLRVGPLERARSVEAGALGLDREWLSTFWPADVPLLDDDAPPLPERRLLHVAAARRDQLAGETLVAGVDGEAIWRGRMSLYLVQALEAAQPGDTWSAVLARTQQAVTGELAAQSVQVEGAEDRVLFGADFRRVEGLRAGLLAGQGAVRIELTVPHGLRRGSRLEVRSGSQRLGEVEVEIMNATQARARWVGEPPSDVPAGELRAIPTTPPVGAEPLRLRCVPELLPSTTGLAPRLVSLVGQLEPSDLELAIEAGRIRLCTAEGLLLLDLKREAPGLEENLREALEDELHWRFLFGLGREQSALPLAARFSIPTQAEIDAAPWGRNKGLTPACLAEVGRMRGAGGELRVRGGSPGLPAVVLLEIENPHPRPLWVAALSISEDRGRSAMRFLDGRATQLLAPGTRVSVPCGIALPEAWPFDRPMRDRYLVLSMEREFDPRHHERHAMLRGEPGSGAGLPPGLLPPGTHLRSAAGSSQAPYGVLALDLLVDAPAR